MPSYGYQDLVENLSRSYKVDMPNSVTYYLERTPIFESYVVGVAPRMDVKKTSCVGKRLDYMLKT